MSLLVLNILLMTLGPFLVVAPLAVAARLSWPAAPASRRVRPVRFRMPSVRVAVTW